MAYEDIGINIGDAIARWGMNRMDRAYRMEDEKKLQEMRDKNEEKAYQRSLKRRQAAGQMPTRKRTITAEDGSPYEIQEERVISDDGQSGSWQEFDRRPLMTAQAKPIIRDFKVGNNVIARERQADGTWKDIASAPRYRSGGGGPAKPQRPSYKEVVDPDYPDSTTYIDQNGKYLTDENGNRVKAPDRGQRNEGLFGRIGKSISRGIDTFSKKVRENKMPMDEQPTEEDMRGLNEAAKRGSSPGSSELMPINISSPQEANSLPPGTWIRLPNGRVGQT